MVAVTILLPTYNRAHFLTHAIESALSQTYSDIQLIILDDASPDDTSGAVRPYLKDPRVRYIRHTQNKGITGNWRAGIELVKTEFFCFLEDDDIFAPEFVAQMVKPLQDNPELILTFCDHWVINAQGEHVDTLAETMSRRFGRHQMRTGPVPDLARTALITGSVGITATMFRSEYVLPSFIRDEASGGIDYWLFYQCARTNRKAYYLSNRLMEYRLHGGGMSHSMPERMATGHLFLYREMLCDPAMEALHRNARRKLHEVGTAYGIHLLILERSEEAMYQLNEALRYGATLRACVAYRLAVWKKGRAIAHLLRKAKQQIIQGILPFLYHTITRTRLLRLAKYLIPGIFFAIGDEMFRIALDS